MKTNIQKIVYTVAALVVGAAMVFIFYAVDPARYAFFPKCPFLTITGYECPGCGSQRAIHDLLHLRVADAFRQNAFIFIAIPYVLFGLYLKYMGGEKRFPMAEKIFFGKWAAIVVVSGILVYWIARNLV